MDFISDNCACGQTILRLVARGNSIIAELMRLSSYVPSVFRKPTKTDERKHRENYDDILPDFSYLKQPDEFENKIKTSKKLRYLDEELKISHMNIIERIYSSFESIHRYITDLNMYIKDLNDGVFVQSSLENIMEDEDGRQLLCEGLYLYGVILLTVDLVFPSHTRERILIFNLRHIGQKASSATTVDNVCKLLRSTDIQATAGKYVDYRENYFMRIKINSEYIYSVIECLQYKDIYNQVPNYPLLEHRTTAYSTQSAMLYICLFFASNILHSEDSKMMKIVEKFYCDNWIISYYMGWTDNLIDSWDSYSSAKQALQSFIEIKNIRKIAKTKFEHFIDLKNRTESLLMDGPLSEKKVVDKNFSIIKLLRECNVVLRWLILHTSLRSHAQESKKATSFRKEVLNELQLSVKDLFYLLFNTANIELSFAEVYKNLLSEKENSWLKYRSICHKNVLDLAQEFMGSRPIAKVRKNERLSQWFKNIGEEIVNLDLLNVVLSQQKIVQICQNVKEIKEYHNLKHSAGIIQALDEIIEYLQLMQKISTLEEETLVVLTVISDMSYAWRLIEQYTPPLQKIIENDPYHVERFRVVFLKLSSCLELPLLRINQSKSSDMISVSAYYSGIVVEYIKTVLQVIPKSMFTILKKIVELQTSMKSVPLKMETIKTNELSQLEYRHKLSELTEKVAVFAGGIIMMKSTLVGIVKIDPKELLEEGVRRELVDQVSHTLDEGFIFTPKKKDLQSSLSEVKRTMIGFQLSFEYIQDYLGINCLKLWHEETNKIVQINVEEELIELGKSYKKLNDSEDFYQKLIFTKSKVNQMDISAINFMGRLTKEILRLTNPRTTYYIPNVRTWYDMKNQSALLSFTFMNDLMSSIGVPGMTGLKKILSFNTIKSLQEVIHICKVATKIAEISSVLREIRILFHESFVIDDVHTIIPKLVQKLGKHFKFFIFFLERITQIGQMQIIQTLLSEELNSKCKLQSKLLSSVVENMNVALLINMKRHERNLNFPQPDKNCSVSCKLTSQLVFCGQDEPMKNIYVTSPPIEFIDELILFSIISQMNKICVYKYSEYSKVTDAVDGSTFVSGITTFLRQLHPAETTKLLTYLSQFAQSYIASNTINYTSRTKEHPSEYLTMVHLIRNIATQSAIHPTAFDVIIPSHLACM